MRALSPVWLLRVASLVMLFYCLGHMSGMPWTPGTGEAAESVVRDMRQVPFETMGTTRAYWDFYYGFGVMVGAFLAMQAATLLWAASLARRDARAVEGFVAIQLVAVLANAYLSFRYFFALPGLFGLVTALLLAISLWSARRFAVAGALALR